MKNKAIKLGIGAKQIEKWLKSNIYFGLVVTQKPNVFVEAKVDISGITYTGYGFSKVNYPDTWNEGRGLECAITRAIRGIRNQMIQTYDKRELRVILSRPYLAEKKDEK